MTTQPKPLPSINTSINGGAYFNWSWQGVGFGQLSFNLRKDSGKFSLDNEGMSREAVRKLMHAYADHVVDNAIFTDSTPEERRAAEAAEAAQNGS